jgi:hypothetical protein
MGKCIILLFKQTHEISIKLYQFLFCEQWLDINNFMFGIGPITPIISLAPTYQQRWDLCTHSHLLYIFLIIFWDNLFSPIDSYKFGEALAVQSWLLIEP